MGNMGMADNEWHEKTARLNEERDRDEWAHLPPAGPDDWEPCPRCYNMDGGCPFCGHGFVPKIGFRWP